MSKYLVPFFIFICYNMFGDFMKCALIIGGVNDIGHALAGILSNNGYKVVMGYHKYKSNYYECVKCDVRREEDIDNVINYCIHNYGKIDVLINMANLSMDNSFLNKTKTEFMNVLETNMVGAFLVNQCYMRYISDGMIINVASSDGIDTGSLYSIDYSCSKAGIICMSKIINEVNNNHVYAICPNWIDSDSTRLMYIDYLNDELRRINQSRLIKISELCDVILDVINLKYKKNIIRVDVRDDKLWIEEM